MHTDTPPTREFRRTYAAINREWHADDPIVAAVNLGGRPTQPIYDLLHQSGRVSVLTSAEAGIRYYPEGGDDVDEADVIRGRHGWDTINALAYLAYRAGVGRGQYDEPAEELFAILVDGIGHYAEMIGDSFAGVMQSLQENLEDPGHPDPAEGW